CHKQATISRRFFRQTSTRRSFLHCYRSSYIHFRKTDPISAMSIASKVKSIVPLLDRVLVQRIKAQEKTAAGIFIPEKSQESLNEGYVVAVGKGALDKEGKHIATQVAVGDKVLLPQYGGSNVKVNDEEYILFRDSEILAKVEEK
ncbi:chaperonin 10-like protein, partial [Jimgerdemannia flammicorona]